MQALGPVRRLGEVDKRPLTFALGDRKQAGVFIKEGILLMLVLEGRPSLSQTVHLST